MKPAEEISNHLKKVQEKLLKKEKGFKRIRWIFKPFIVLGFVLLFLSMLLPFIAPFALPVVIAGALAQLIRFLLYKFAFGDPKEKFQQAFEEEILEMLSEFGTFQKTNKLNITKEEFDTIKVGVKTADGAYNGPRYDGLWNGVSTQLGYVSAMNESWSLGGMFQDMAEGILDDFTGMGFDPMDAYVSYSSDRKKIYKGLIVKIKASENLGDWMLAPTSVAKLLREKSRFVVNWKNADLKDYPYTIFTKSGELNQATESLSKLVMSAKASVISITANGEFLYLSFPWKDNYLEPEIDSKFSTSSRFFKSLHSQFSFINSCIAAIR